MYSREGEQVNEKINLIVLLSIVGKLSKRYLTREV